MLSFLKVFVEFFNSFKMVLGDPTFSKHLTNRTLELLRVHILLTGYPLTKTKIVKIGPLEAKICPLFFIKVSEIGL